MEQITATAPKLIERTCGGWLAVSAPDAPLKIGVTADTAENARTAFDRAILEWQMILESGVETGEH